MIREILSQIGVKLDYEPPWVVEQVRELEDIVKQIKEKGEFNLPGLRGCKIDRVSIVEIPTSDGVVRKGYITFTCINGFGSIETLPEVALAVAKSLNMEMRYNTKEMPPEVVEKMLKGQ